ncbi:hypothetical protein V6N13_020446 [Hibiscus sabdariffa]
MSCRLCGQFGHNIRTCPKKKKSDALNDVTEIEPITLNSSTQEQNTTETSNQATTRELFNQGQSRTKETFINWSKREDNYGNGRIGIVHERDNWVANLESWKMKSNISL